VPIDLSWEIKVVTVKPHESSWANLISALELFFDNIRVVPPESFLQQVGGDFIFTDDKDIFVISQERGLRALFLPAPSLRQDVADLFKHMGYTLLTSDAYRKMEEE